MKPTSTLRSTTDDLDRLDGYVPVDELAPHTRAALDAAGVDLDAVAGQDGVVRGKAELRALGEALADGRPSIRTHTHDSSGQWTATDAGLALRLFRGELARRGAERVLDATAPASSPTSRGQAAAFIERAARVDKATAAESAADIEEATGLRVRNWLFRADEPRDARVVELAFRVARPDLGITPELLLIVALGEGLVGFGSTKRPIDTAAPVDGYEYLGTDIIGSAAASLQRKGLLRADFREGVDYIGDRTTNDGQTAAEVHTATFTDLERGFEAVVALLADAQAHFRRDYDSRHGDGASSQLDARTLLFFTALYYNTGAGIGRKVLEKRGLAAIDRKYAQDLDVTNKDAPLNAQQKLNVYDHWVALGVVPAAR